jgi:LmbE family N-acetylglucosaminyl deacetylase
MGLISTRPATVAILFAGLTAIAAVGQPLPPGNASGIPSLTLDIGPSTRLLVVSPHPDDETLGAAGLMRRVVSKGGSVQVVWTTSGDGFPEGVEAEEGIKHPTPADYRSYGSLREVEARAAVESLGVDRRSLLFLGFPDAGLCELASKYLSEKVRAYQSPFTDRISPPLTERVIRGVRYRGTDVRRELERIISAFLPTVIAVSHPEDSHPDHCSTHIFVLEALDALSRQGHPRPRILHYLIHFKNWPLSPDAGTGPELRPPAGFPSDQGPWASLALTPDEIAAKKQALLAYRSQLLVIGRFMLAFGRSNELFIETEPASLPECWCDNDTVATELPTSHYRRRPTVR